ncbi:MAG: SDR family oxidoreductase [Peptococcaceae bacterium]|nr:SDR family oxidoreductase [Peptococcaceae bacterium]MBP3341813.1 SDR family oxidoreductase [Peptococcaceae bacterium]MBP3625214.1 SDR family oxidoreductase [Peptococcaceae bacterium]
MLLQDKVAVVTGAASGLGKAITLEYLKQGATVIATDINAENLKRLRQENVETDCLYTVLGDVSDKKDDEALIAYVYEQFGKLDILVNNAGISDGMIPVDEVTDELWEKMMAVDLNGPFYLCRAALQRVLNDEKPLSIVNIASAAGVGGGRAGAAYVTAKFGLVGMSKNIAYMYGPKNIRCNVICPGHVATGIQELNYVSSEYGVSRVMKGTQVIRVGNPQEIADLAVFLASDKSSLVNGETILADAGKGAY